MKARMLSMLIAGALSISAAAGSAMSPLPRTGVGINGRFNCPLVSSRGGLAYLEIALNATGVSLAERRPVNLSVVLDRSGSMADEGKIQHAKAALNALIDQLESEDILSIVIYDDVVDVLRPAGRVGDKAALRRLVECVYPRGWTNLGGGMVEGFHQAERYACSDCVNRVVLLSDGLANRGITNPYELGRIARQYRGRSISLSTMGVGLAYDENLMVSLSENGGGNYYYIESSRDLASVLRREFSLLSCVVAQNATVELTLARGVKVRDVIGYEYRTEGMKVEIPVGDLYSGDRREITVELEIPEGCGTLTAVRGNVRFDSDAAARLRSAGFAALLQYTDDLARVEQSRDLDVQARADVAVSTRSVEKALKMLDEGKREEAEKELASAARVLGVSSAAGQAGAPAAVIQEQQSRVQSFSDMLKDSRADAARAKKAIQYENYRTQKQR